MQRVLAQFKASATVRSFAWLVLDRGVRMVLAVFVGLWVARYLGPGQLGLLNYALAGVALAGPLAELGFEAVARREFVLAPKSGAVLAGTVLRLRLLGGVMAAVAIAGVALLSGMSAKEGRLFVLLAIGLLQPGPMVAESWLQSRLEAGKSVVPQWIAMCMGAGLRIGAIVWRAPVEAFAAIVVVEMGLAAVLVVGSARATGFQFGRFDPSLARRLLSESWPLAVASVAVMIYMRVDILMLRWMAGETASGQYAAAVRLSELGYFIPMIVAASVQPLLARLYQGDGKSYLRELQKYFELSTLMAYVLALPAGLLAPWIIRLAYGPQYADAAVILAVHAWAVVFVFLGVARSQFLINAGLTQFSLFCTVAGAVANVILNLFLIPRWGGEGAAMATVVSYAVSAWMTSFFSHKVRPVGWMQTKAMLSPFTAWRYLCKS